VKHTPSNIVAAKLSSEARLPVNTFHLGYRPSLDGLRGVSVLAVVLAHAHLIHGRAPGIGVAVFFVLSGFLITCLLLQEWEKTGGIKLKNFYGRRVLRLFPALVAMLTAFVVYHWIFASRKEATLITKDALVALFYFKNWWVAHTYLFDLFSHAWSLSIEEQFYLLWPPLLLLLLKRLQNRQQLVPWLLLGLFLAMLDRVGLVWWNAYPLRIELGTDTTALGLLLGCLVAALVPRNGLPGGTWWTRALSLAALAAVSLLIALTLTPASGRQFEPCVVMPLVYLSAACIIASLIWNRAGWLCRVLSQGWLVYVGKISYGLYIWHSPLFLLVQSRGWPLAKELAIELPLALLITLTSFYFLERPFLKLKERLSAA
jgi:peptidoglycan/LPS O-acetylase OafA/YrhL